jgi:ankyrin repeat protein
MDAKDQFGLTPLFYAAQENKREVTRLLLGRGASREGVSKLSGFES